MRRLLPLVASLAVAALVLTGCGSGPSRADAAAVVGDQVILLETVQQRLRASAPDLQALADRQAVTQGRPPGAPLPPAALAEQARGLVTAAVLHAVVAEQSRRDGIVVPPEQVDALLAPVGGVAAAAARSGYDPDTVREQVSDQIAAVQIGRRAFDRLQVTLDFATLPNRAEADALARRVATDPAGASAAFAGFSPADSATDVTLRPGTDQGVGTRSSALLPFGLPGGTVTVTSTPSTPAGSGAPAPDPTTQPWTVIHIRERTMSAPPPGPGTIPAAQVDDTTMINFGLRMLQPLAAELGVTVNPRFGTWDPTQLGLATTPAAVGTITPVRAPAPAP